MAKLILIGIIVQSVIVGAIGWIFRGQCFQYANFSYVKNNEVLQGSIIATLPGKSTTECEAECVKEYRCKSINIQIAGQRNCELNSANVMDKMANLTLTSKAGWTYKATNYNETLVGGNCKYFKPCAVNHVCVDSCDCPGYICYRCRGIHIGIDCLANFAIDGQALGMQSRKIEDWQITASSVNTNHQTQIHARLNLGNTAWCAGGGAEQNLQQWIQVDLIRRKIITDIAVQSYKDQDEKVNSYQLQYTEDNNAWQTYNENGEVRTFLGVTARNVVVKESLIYYIPAYAVRINPRSWEHHMCLRMELYGIDDPWQPAVAKYANGLPLGIEDRRIKNHQMSASWRTGGSERAHNARLNSATRWCDPRISLTEYIRVDFNSRKIITDVAIQGHHTEQSFVSSYLLLYTEDSYEWKTYQVNGTDKLFAGPTSNFAIKKEKLPYHIRAFAIKINPKTWEYRICLRMELYGFEDPAQLAVPAGCSNNARPLGIASHTLPDSNLTASGSHSSGYTPKYARLNGDREWCEISGVNTANKYYIQNIDDMLMYRPPCEEDDITLQKSSYRRHLSHLFPSHGDSNVNNSSQEFPRNASKNGNHDSSSGRSQLGSQLASYKRLLISDRSILQMITQKRGAIIVPKNLVLRTRPPEVLNMTNISSSRNQTIDGKKILVEQRRRLKEIDDKLRHMKIATIIESVLGSVVIIVCIFCLLMYKVLRVEETTKVFLHKNLFLTWILSYGFQIAGSILGSTLEKKKDLCTAFLIVIQYFLMSFFCWMSLEGLNLLLLLVFVFHSRKRRHFLYALAGWGLPLCIVVIEVAAFFESFSASISCVGLEKNDWLFKGPMGFLLSVNCLFFIAIIVVLLKSITKSAKHATTAAKSRATGRAFLVLFPLLGLTFFLGYAAKNTAVMYIYALVNPLMGILLCIFNFFLDKSVQTAYQDYKRKRATIKGFHGNFNSMQLSKVSSSA